MTGPRILFRADASHAIGFGHVARVCALIEEVAARGGEPVALFGGDPAALPAWVRTHGLATGVHPWTTAEVVTAASDPQVHAVVVDGPALAAAVLPALPGRVRRVLIDDVGGCALAVEAVVNHNVHAPTLATSYAGAADLLLGRRYLMLRRDIRRFSRGACRPRPGARLRVVVSFGGSDPVGATARVLGLLPPDRGLDVTVIAGPGYRANSELYAAAAAATAVGHTVDVRRAPADPGALFVTADAAICSAGGTLGELAYLGCPALAYAIAADQIVPAHHQRRDGLIAGGGNWLDCDDAAIVGDLHAFLLDDAGRYRLRGRALASADGDGPRRIFDEALA